MSWKNFIWYKPSVKYQKTTTTHFKETGQSGYNDKESQEKIQQKSQKNLSKNSEMNTFILKNSMKIKSPNFIYNSWIKNTTSIPFLNSSKAIIILPGTKPFIPDSETCVLKIIKKFFFFLSYFTFLTFMIFFLEIFYSTWDIKLYIEVTKNYDMVTIKKKFFISFFCHVLLIKNPKKCIYILILPAQSQLPRSQQRGKNCDCISSSRVESLKK